MPRDYWGQFVKDCDRLFRDANGIVKRNYDTLERNIRNERDRMTERVDCLNRIREFEKTMQREPVETNTLDERDKKFLELMETIRRIVDILQNVHTLCSPMLADTPSINPGALESDITRLDEDRQLLREQINGFRLLVAVDDPKYSPHLAFLIQVDGVLQGRVLRTICLETRNVINRGDREQIKQYGDLAGTLIQQFDGMIATLNWEMSNVEEGNQLIPSEDNNRNDNVL